MWLVCREPDLTKDPSDPHAALQGALPSHSSFAEREGTTKKGQNVARLHCKAFQFPVSLTIWRHDCVLQKLDKGSA